MTDNEIMKALECCGELIRNPCSQCPYFHEKPCLQLKRDALDLIKRQQAEIERLTAQNGVNETCSARKQEAIEHLETELKAMRGAANSYKLHYGNLRMEIVREFADRLKESLHSVPSVYNSHFGRMIDNLLKEMEKECEPKD